MYRVYKNGINTNIVLDSASVEDAQTILTELTHSDKDFVVSQTINGPALLKIEYQGYRDDGVDTVTIYEFVSE